MNEPLFRLAFWVWLAEIGLSGVNFFLLMNRVYAPRLGPLRAHQIGMATRIVYIFAFAGYLVTRTTRYSTVDLVYVGLFWLGLSLTFEWAGSALIRRPVREVLVGWHVERGYMWPYVLVAYLVAPLTVGSVAGS